MKIAIVGVTGFRNRGVEALVVPVVEHLLRRYPGAEITIATWSPEYDRLRITDGRVRFVEDEYLRNGKWKAGEPARRQVWWRRGVAKVLRKVGKGARAGGVDVLRMPFERADLVVLSGGDLLSSDYGTDSLRHFLRPAAWAVREGVPSVLLGQSIGRFKNDEDVAIWKEASALPGVITLREGATLEYLSGVLGQEAGRYEVTADTAFLLEPDGVIAAQERRTGGRPVVGLSISESIAGFGRADYDEHVRVWCGLVRMILDEWGADVAIIPHVQERFADDRVVAMKVFRGVGCDHRVRVFGEDLTAAEFKGILSSCEMVVAERMHAAIGGFSSGVCTVPIGYSIKAEGITRAVVGPQGVEASELMMPLGELMDLAGAKERLTRVWERREHYRAAIEAGRERMVREAERNFELIDGVVGKRG